MVGHNRRVGQVTIELGAQPVALGADGDKVRALSAAALTPAMPATTDGDLVAAIEAVSMAIDAVTARSLATISRTVTTAQLRALSALMSPSPHRLADMAEALGVTPSTATRMCDRLVARGLVRRARAGIDRRELDLSLTPAGRELVDAAYAQRSKELSKLLDGVPEADRRTITLTLQHISLHALATRKTTAALRQPRRS